MSFELLPNEILLDIFEYFNGIDLLRIFYGLNCRINMVLHERFPTCTVDLHLVSKRYFDILCRSHFPTMSKYISSFHLSDSEETPRQIELFLSSLSSFQELSQLKILSISYLRSHAILTQILQGCFQLSNLTQLTFSNCYLQDDCVDFQSIINQIWSLEKLTHCTLGIAVKRQCVFCTPTVISSTLKSLSFEKLLIELKQINQLFEFTPNLQRLSLSVLSFVDSQYQPAPLPTVTNLNIHSVVKCDASNMSRLLENLPNLQQLSIDLSCEIVNGNDLETIISNHLPKLETLRLKMKMVLSPQQDPVARFQTLFNSYRTAFWIDERRWFVRCLTSARRFYVYSISKIFEENIPLTFNSTDPHDDERDINYALMKISSYEMLSATMFSNAYFTKLKELHISLPIDERFWTATPNLNQLQTLKIMSHTHTFRSQVQALLKRTPNLYRLSICQQEPTILATSLFKYTNASIRELDLLDMSCCFDKQDCLKLSLSPLGEQCEKLSVLVADCQCIISLIENMSKLRVLNVRCRDEQFVHTEMNEDERTLWLKDHLPTGCVVIRNPKCTCNILIWI
ncbi:unnamed protein product [Adineta ricciae]|uniref:F-box domain-containing protein n=1 Tax=Adineta ricciae TaxID=249248 RepID=A0A813SF64_ADIRI|nr:unnamed protein product [Adineta ricciae]CAF1290735.1 unnamed protein product [Adineta ricciae]